MANGIGAFLAGVRVVFNNPATRSLLKAASKRTICFINGKPMKERITYFALASYAGEEVICPNGKKVIASVIDLIIKLSAKMFKVDEKEVIEAFKDPAVRRGIALVLEGLGRYGVTVPQRLPAPFLIVWNFTNMCNLRCKHCYQRADHPLPNELSLQEKIDVINQLDESGVAAVALSGGEPTIHPHYFKVVKEMADRGIYVATATNGWLFANMEMIKKAKRLGLRYVEVSVDSANPKKHDEFRGVPGSWERAVKALENAVKIGLNHAMAVTITKMNLDEVDEILDLAESIGVKRVVFFNFVPTGRGKEIVDYDLSPEEREEFLKKIVKEMQKRKLEIFSTAPQYGRVTLLYAKTIAPTHFYVSINKEGVDKVISALAEFIGGCGAGRIYAALEPDGTVTPCVFLPIPVGNVRETHFRVIWELSDLFNKLRDRNNLWGACRTCPYREICGGCRARAYAYFKDPLAPDPGCIYNKKYYEELVRLAVKAR